jgi:hypothetical protein
MAIGSTAIDEFHDNEHEQSTGLPMAEEGSPRHV